MSRIAYVNGQYITHDVASIHVEDRSVQFSDGVYEVCPVHKGVLLDEALHYERLQQSLDALSIRMPLSTAALSVILREIVRRNRVRHGIVYFQISRGSSPRNHAFPPPNVTSSLIVTARSTKKQDKLTGIKVITLPDIRWQRVDIKSLSLLPNVLARESAKQEGAQEAWLVGEDGVITEGAAANAWIVDKDNCVITRHLGNKAVLRGITRTVLLDLIDREGLSFSDKGFDVAQAKQAREAFVTSASADVTPVIQIDDTVINDGKAGEVSRKLSLALKQAIDLQISTNNKS